MAQVSLMIRKYWLKVILTLIIIAGAPIQASPKPIAAGASSTVTDSWPMLKHDPAHSGFDASRAPHSPRILWSFQTGSSIYTSPIIANGSVYVQPTDVYALNQSSGKLIWKVQTGFVRAATPALYGDSIYAGGGNSVYRIRTSTGEIVWKITIGAISDISLIAVAGRIYVAAGNILGPGRVYCVNAQSGSIIWNATGGFGETGYADGIVYTGNNSTIDALNATTGRLVWSYSIGSKAYDGYTLSDGVVYGGGDDLYALNATSGNLIWENNNTGPLGGAPSVAYGRIFQGHPSGISAYAQATGRFLWGFDFRGLGVSFSQSAVADGLVFVGGGASNIPDPTIYALNATTGKIAWFLPVVGGANSSPAISNGTLYVGDDNGTLYAVIDMAASQPVHGFPETLILQVLIASAIVVFVIIILVRKHPKTMMQTASFQGI